jgi:hypothetical protein
VYRTAAKIGSIEAGRLVYFHNHGNPGPGIYPPEGWTNNRARFSANGQTMATPFDDKALLPLRAEGFYRVLRPFHCCSKECVEFQPDTFVQLGYNGGGRALLFVPQMGPGGISIPERGTMLDDDVLDNLAVLSVAENKQAADLSVPRGFVVH